MKSIALLSVLLVGLSAQALPKYEILECKESIEFASAVLYLDSTQYREGSDFSAPVGAVLVYNYSGTQGMVCDGMVKGVSINVSCVGFFNSYDDDIALVKFTTNEDGTYKANWTTAKSYGQISIETECVRKEDPIRGKN